MMTTKARAECVHRSQPRHFSADSETARSHSVDTQKGDTACIKAALGGHETVVRLLLESGAEVNAADEVMRAAAKPRGSNCRSPPVSQAMSGAMGYGIKGCTCG